MDDQISFKVFARAVGRTARQKQMDLMPPTPIPSLQEVVPAFITADPGKTVGKDGTF